MTECDRKIFRKKVAENLVMKIGAGESAGMNLEKGVFNSALQEAERRGVVKRWDNPAFQRLYKNRLRSVFRNLSSDFILQMIRSGKIQAHKLAFMSHQDMQPEKWDALLEAKKTRDACLYEPQIDANTDNFKCRKCKSTRCSYYQLQTRSADEPMTTFVTCINCGNRWKC